SLDRPQHSAVGVADDSLGLTRQRAEESAPVGRMCARKCFCVPELRLAGLVADRAEDVEGDPPGGNALAVGVQGADPEGQVIEQERALRWPEGGPVGLEDDRREELDP